MTPPAPPALPVGTFRDLMNGYDSAEILNLFNREQVVRRLALDTPDRLRIDAGRGQAVVVHPDTPITYQPWFMDRGSLLFECAGYRGDNAAKIATELDIIRYPDNTERTLVPARS